jgi:surfeit locus 1 family protein
MTKVRTDEISLSDAQRVSQSVPLRPKKFAPKLWFTLLAFATAIGTAALSRWQFNRADQKAALQTQLEALQKAPPLTSLAAVQLPAQRYATVELAGAFDAKKTVLHDNQIQAGKAGLHVYTLFRPANGERAVLVNRGWLAVPTDRRLIAAPDATAIPAAQFSLVGRINSPAERTKRLADNADTAAIVQTIDLAALAARFAEPLAPYVIEQTKSASAADTLVRAWTPPNLKIDTHRMYAGQWLCFSALSLILWLVLSFRRPTL